MFADFSSRLAYSPPTHHEGVAVADVDGDGRFEFLVVGKPTRILKWLAGRLVEVTPPALAVPARSIAAADLDGDGREELYFAAAGMGPDRLFRRTQEGEWDDLLARAENRFLRSDSGRTVVALDRRGVGRYGFAVATAGGTLRLIEIATDGRLLDLAPALELARQADFTGLFAAPLLGDHTDLFAANPLGSNVFFRNRGDGTFEECAVRMNLADPLECSLCAVAVDAGGELALGCGSGDGPNRLLLRQSGGAWRERASPAFAFPAPVRALLAADFDNDGNDELLFLNHGVANRAFRVLPTPGGFPDLAMLDPGDAGEPEELDTAAAVADIDGDGLLELLLCHEPPRAMRFFKARNPSGQLWLRIQPLTRFGAPARGAVVRAECDDRVRVKVIDGGASEPVAHFGLGRTACVRRVVVTWPDGASLAMRDPDPNSRYTVPYPGG